jgi:oligoendopeptidase F
LPVLHRYFKLRQRMLKLPDLHYYDVYPDLVKSERRYPLEESSALTLAAMKPLGDEYQSQLKLALSARTMHVRPQPGKSSGAYQTGVYGLMPYVFLNHTDNFESLVTFAHEWGHGMHTILAQRAQPFETAGYPLFLAEIASTTNEVLLTDHMLKVARTPEEKVFVLTHVLERLRASFFRQTMFAEFELLAHDAQQRGEALSGKKFTSLYCGLLRKYHGADAGVMTIDPQYCQEWAYVPHFYRPFYVYAYATSATAAQFFGEQILAGKPGAREAYLSVLRGGSSLPPHEALKKAGLDLATPAPYQFLFSRMNAVMDDVERLLP